MTIATLCVYCGASSGNDPAYADAARAMGAALAGAGVGLVYGGGKVGLMGVIADAVLRQGGRAVGVIPQALMEKEVGHTGLTELHVVRDMHERKAKMAALADGFIAMPGGMGTLEELFEVITWAQLGIHRKPIGLYNPGGFWDGLRGFIDHMVAQGFVRRAHADMLQTDADPRALLDKLRAFRPSAPPRWDPTPP